MVVLMPKNRISCKFFALFVCSGFLAPRKFFNHHCVNSVPYSILRIAPTALRQAGVTTVSYILKYKTKFYQLIDEMHSELAINF